MDRNDQGLQGAPRPAARVPSQLQEEELPVELVSGGIWIDGDNHGFGDDGDYDDRDDDD